MLQNQSNILYVFCFFNFHYQNRSSELNYYIKLFSNANILNKNIKCKLYVYFENQNCIGIKLKDNSYIFFNDKSNDETLKYYSELEKALEKS